MKKHLKELEAAYKFNVCLSELPDQQSGKKTIVYGLTPMLPMHLGFDPIIVTLRHFQEQGYRIRIIFGDSYLHMEDKLKIGTPEYKNICDYYRYLFSANGLEEAHFILHSQATSNSRYWFLLANLANDMSLRNVYQSLPVEYRNSSVPLAKSMHTLMQTADINYFGATYIVGSRSQERIYFVSRELLRKNNMPVAGATLINEVHDLLGNDLKESSSRSRLSYHENEESLRMKLGQLNTEDGQIILSLFLNSVLPFGTVKFQGSVLTVQLLEELISNKMANNFTELIDLLYNALIHRLNKLNAGFKEHPELLSWIDLNRVRAIANK